MTRLYDNSASAYRVLKPERWVNRQHHGSTGAHHARYMRSHCQAFPSAALCTRLSYHPCGHHSLLSRQGLWMGKGRTITRTYRCLYDSFPERSRGVLTCIQMPFLHWESKEIYSGRESIVKFLNEEQSMDERLTRDQKLVKVYLNDEHPLHIRRTLDQYYYHTAADTGMRDEDQLLGCYQVKKGLQPKILTMVDQLWLWVLKGEQSKPDTVVSCFPVVDSAYPDPQGLTNVLRCVKLRILDEPASVQTAYDLAGVIAATCSRIYLDRESTLSFENTKSTLQFSELYETEIVDSVCLRRCIRMDLGANLCVSEIQEESVLFGNFTKLEKENLADIQREIVLLSRIKSVLDELNVMAMLFNDQRNILKAMDGIVKFISALETADQSPDITNSENESRSISDAAVDPDKIARIEGSYAGQRGTEIWGARNDPDDFSLPLAMVKASIDEIDGMLKRAERVSQSVYNHLNRVFSEAPLITLAD